MLMKINISFYINEEKI